MDHDPRPSVGRPRLWLAVAVPLLVAGCSPGDEAPDPAPAAGDTIAPGPAADTADPLVAAPSAAGLTHEIVADYESNGDTLIVREAGGRIEALLRGATYPLRPGATGAGTFILEGGRGPADRELRFQDDGGGRIAVALLADVPYRRIRYGGEAGATFRIDPMWPVETLRAEARAAAPPLEDEHLRVPDLVDLETLDPTLRFDIRYATTNNFMGAAFYEEARAFLQRPAAEALVRAHRRLRGQGLGLLVFDAYRPWSVTWMFWRATPREQRDFVANPAFGSRHNRGAAVDVTLYDLATGEPVPMPSGYDEFSRRAHPDYPGGMSAERQHRDLLRAVMESEGFRVYHVEWWHFDHRDWQRYPILNLTFDQIEASPGS